MYRFKRVVAADLSPTMLRETLRRIRNEKIDHPYELVRCDSARLPFRSNSLDAIHAGAAIHCWPQLNTSLAEVHRVLRPGGVIYASTFLNLSTLSDDNAPFNQFKSTSELQQLFQDAGFNVVNGQVNVRKEGVGCAIIKAVKLEETGNLNQINPDLLKVLNLV